MGAPGFCNVKQKKSIFFINMQKFITSNIRHLQTKKNHNASEHTTVINCVQLRKLLYKTNIKTILIFFCNSMHSEIVNPLIPINGYQYWNITTRHTWQRSREICQGWGGDLIVHGVQNADTRA